MKFFNTNLKVKMVNLDTKVGVNGMNTNPSYL